MLARLLESPAGLNDEILVEELSDLLLRYLVDDEWLAQHEPQPVSAEPVSGTKTARRGAAVSRSGTSDPRSPRHR